MTDILKIPAHHRRLPQQFGAFLMDKALWRGKNSCVYYARDLRDQAAVALKIFYPQADCDLQTQRQGAVLEATRLREIRHPNIIELRQQGEVEALPYLSFPLINGHSLEVGSHNEGKLERPLALSVMLKVCAAIEFAHSKGVIHRDLKPSNIMLDSRYEPHVLDWGLSWRRGDRSHRTVQKIVGTPSYMSPEQARGEEEKLTPATDVFSLGAILYFLLTARAPFEADSTWKTLQMTMSVPPQKPGELADGLDPRIENIVLTCLEKEPAQRYQSAGSLAADLQRVLDDQTPKGRSGFLGRLFS